MIKGLINKDLSYNTRRFVRGSLINATELTQTKRDLRRLHLTGEARESLVPVPLSERWSIAGHSSSLSYCSTCPVSCGDPQVKNILGVVGCLVFPSGLF